MMTRARPRQRGFTLFELAIVFLIAGVAGTVFLERLRFLQGMAEKAKMESELRTIKTGLQVRLAELIVTNRQADAIMLETEDPMKWLDDKPGNYRGTYQPKTEPGTWNFDERARQLVYVVHIRDRLVLEGQTEPKEIRFRARLLKDWIRVGGDAIESVTGVTLVPVLPYLWSGFLGESILT